MRHNSFSSQQTDRSTKFKGLGRLKWYCTPCKRQLYDENAFKLHTLSRTHVHQIDAISPNVGRAIQHFSQQFKSDFLDLLRVNHQDKTIHANKFYQTYIANRDHIHLNDTCWHNLTDFTRSLGREGLCRVEEKNDGIYIGWVKTSPDALQKTLALKKKAMEDKVRQRREDLQLQEQVKRAYAMRSSDPSSSTPTSTPLVHNSHTNFEFSISRKVALQTEEPENPFKISGKKRPRPVEEAELEKSSRVKR